MTNILRARFNFKTYLGENNTTGAVLAFATAALLFMPVYLTVIPGAALVVWSLCNRACRQKFFKSRDIKLLLLFSVMLITVPLAYRNFLGALTGIGVIALIIFALAFSVVLSPGQFEQALSIICGGSVFGVLVAAVQMLAHLGDDQYRAASVTVNTNFYAAMAALAAIICLYKLTVSNNKLLYICIFITNIFGILLSDSRSAILAIFAGAVIFFFVSRQKKPLCAVLIALGILALVFLIKPELLGRFADVVRDSAVRISLWRAGLEGFLSAPLTGKGCFSLLHNNIPTGAGFQPHAHNIYIEILQNFGILGAGIIIIYFVGLIYNIYKRESRIFFAFIAAAFGYICVHGMLDVTVIWPGASLIILIIFSKGCQNEARS